MASLSDRKEKLEWEIGRWDGFVLALRKPEREAFEALMAACRKYYFECSKAPGVSMFEPMVFSILLSHQLKISQLEKELQKIKQNKQQTPL